MNEKVYAKAPLEVREGIPIFSHADDYTENYEKISFDHMSHFQKTGVNPFIPEDVWKPMEDSTIRLLSKYSHAGDRILDVGVGTGRLLARVPDLERYGMDISETYLRETKGLGIQVCYARVEDMPYQEGFFDVVTCTDVLEHVLDLNLACRQILSVLRPGGVLIIRVPYRDDLSGYASPSLPYRYVHLRSFDEFALQILFTRIFPCEVLEHSFVWTDIGRMRFVSRLPINRVRLALLKAIRKLDVPGARLLWESEMLPSAVNIVVRKPVTAKAPCAGSQQS